MHLNIGKITFFFIFLLFSLSACTQNAKTEPATTATAPKRIEVKNIDVGTFKSLMEDKSKVILDVRTPEEIADGMIEGAIHIDYYASDFADKIAELDKDKEYLVYCRSGGRSAKSAKQMQEVGINKVYNLAGGYTAWSAQ